MSEPTLSDGYAGLRAAVDLARLNGMSSDVLAMAEYGLKVMKFIAANPALYKEVARVERELPAVATLMRDLPSLKIVDMRETP